ncbi:MAG TPA: ChaN family lipoprotein [Bacteroidales bacterium]|nr:ChaN family lipoprotein [Bacteroidales bacterium]
MKKIFTLIVVSLFIQTLLFSQTNQVDKPAYLIYNAQGELVSFSTMIQTITKADVCLFGELHNDPISHWLELEIMKSLYEIKKDSLIVGAEMWESDNQLLLDEAFTNKFYDEAMYIESSKLWPNLKYDYLPLLQYAVKNNLKFIATNIPRRYARMVSKMGIESLDGLSPVAKGYIAPLPIPIDLNEYAYKSMIQDMPSGGNMKMVNPENLAKAQAVKDATMAHFILKNWVSGSLFYHFHGEFHSAFYSGITYYLKNYNPKVKVKTISIVKQSDIQKLDAENLNRADFVIVVPEEMSVTY